MLSLSYVVKNSQFPASLGLRYRMTAIEELKSDIVPKLILGSTQVLVSEQLNNTPMLGWILRMLEFPGLGECYQVNASLSCVSPMSVAPGSGV